MVSFASRERVFIFVGSPIRDVRVLLVQVDSCILSGIGLVLLSKFPNPVLLTIILLLVLIRIGIVS